MTPEEQAVRIAELEAQVAVLKKIAEEEVAIRIAYENNMSPVECREYSHCQARRQLAEEHPEAFRCPWPRSWPANSPLFIPPISLYTNTY